MIRPFRAHWLVGALTGAPLLLALTPALEPVWPAWLLWLFLQQPLYMLHQLEEHVGDRFRRFVNQRLAGGAEVLTLRDVAVINVVGVWVVNAVALLLAVTVHPAWGLLGVYLTLVNALIHMVAAIVLRIYNPGLVTAVVLFLPAGLTALVLLARQPGVGLLAHLGAFAFIALLHGAIVLHMLRVKRRLAA